MESRQLEDKASLNPERPILAAKGEWKRKRRAQGHPLSEACGRGRSFGRISSVSDG